MNYIKGAVQAARGAALGDSPGDGTTKLESFLTTLATYPFLHLAATSAAAPTSVGNGVARPIKGPLVSAGQQLVDVVAKHGKAAATSGTYKAEPARTLGEYAEGKALVLLERWCEEPVLPTKLKGLAYKMREWLLALIAWQQDEWASLAKAPLPTPVKAELQSTYQYTGQTLDDYPQAKQAVIKLLQLWSKALDVYVGPRPPTLSVDMATVQQLALLQAADLSSNHTAAGDEYSPLGSCAANPVARCAAAVTPNVRFITQELQHKYNLTRSKTIVEWLNVLLGVVRLWLHSIAMLFYLFAAGLRILGNGLSALGGLFAFTVVLSIAISVLSSLTFLSASACDATGTFLEYMARFTDLAKRRTGAARGMASPLLQDKLGPRDLGPLTFEELEDFFTLQLAHGRALAGRMMPAGSLQGGGMTSLRNRPDVPRLAHDPLLVLCYDYGLIDSAGSLNPGISVDEVAATWDPQGFFGHSSMLTSKAGAVLLLRLLAWKNIALIMSPPATLTAPYELDRALRYLFVAGIKGCGISSTYKALTGLPQQYQVGANGKAAEVRSIWRMRSAYAVLARGADHPTPAEWIIHPSHGVVSGLVFVVSVDTQPSAFALPEAIHQGDVPEQQEVIPVPSTPLDVVWQVLAMRKPVLLAINKAGKLKDQMQAAGADSLALPWRSWLKEEAARRGLESEHITVMVVELMDVPPPGAVGVPQMQDWVMQSLAQAPQQR